jgi:hypothetical protein
MLNYYTSYLNASGRNDCSQMFGIVTSPLE